MRFLHRRTVDPKSHAVEEDGEKRDTGEGGRQRGQNGREGAGGHPRGRGGRSFAASRGEWDDSRGLRRGASNQSLNSSDVGGDDDPSIRGWHVVDTVQGHVLSAHDVARRDGGLKRIEASSKPHDRTIPSSPPKLGWGATSGGDGEEVHLYTYIMCICSCICVYIRACNARRHTCNNTR